MAELNGMFWSSNFEDGNQCQYLGNKTIVFHEEWYKIKHIMKFSNPETPNYAKATASNHRQTAFLRMP